MTSLLLTDDVRAALRSWAAEHRTPTTALVRELLDRIAADPIRAFEVTIACGDVPVRGGQIVPVAVADRARWAAAKDALSAAFGGAVPTGRVVRGLLVDRLRADGVLPPR